MTELRTYSSPEALTEAAADAFVELSKQFIEMRGHFTVCLSGGSTPKAMFELLASESYRDKVEWDKLHVYWGDERAVPPDHEDSNYHMAYETLLKHVPIPENQIHRMLGELDPKEAAGKYTRTLLPPLLGYQLPVFNLIFLGMGDDGHTASLFPGTDAVREDFEWVVENYVEKLDSWRITLTPPIINAAEYIIFLVAGEKKAPVLKEVLQGTHLINIYPSQVIKPTKGQLIWMVDKEAAAELNM